MPLILISGYPSSGKSYRARQLQHFLQEKIAVRSGGDSDLQPLPIIHHINDESLGISRTVYGDGNATAEKEARAKLMSALKRTLSPKSFVIADGLNYIKGYRYQIYCEAKAAKTSSCVVHIGTPVATCREQNAEILALGKGGYPPDIFESLLMRYEEPNGLARWDSPLFTVIHSDELPPCDAIWSSLMGEEGKGVAVKPNLATVAPTSTSDTYLADVSRMTQEVVDKIIQCQSDTGPGSEVAMNPTQQLSLQLPVNSVNAGQLQRIRRQYINLTRSHSIPVHRIERGFVEYVAKTLGTDGE